MNKTFGLILVVIIAFLFTACSRNNPAPNNLPQQQDTSHWTKINTGLGDISLSEIYFTDSLHGFIAASDRYLYSSRDGGLTWKKIPNIKGKTQFLSIHFLNQDQGYIVGDDGLAVTSDGGANWSVKPFINVDYEPKIWINIQFVSPAIGYITTGRAAYKTIDTGTTWKKIIPNYTNSIYFKDDHNGWAYTAPASISVTSDGGEHWQHLSSVPTYNTGADLYDVLQFTSAQYGWLMDYITFCTTNDGGIHWTKSLTDQAIDSTGFTDFQMLTDQAGYLATHAQILKTTDGGVNWKQDYKIPSDTIISIYFLNGNYGWAGCSNGTVLKYRH